MNFHSCAIFTLMLAVGNAQNIISNSVDNENVIFTERCPPPNITLNGKEVGIRNGQVAGDYAPKTEITFLAGVPIVTEDSSPVPPRNCKIKCKKGEWIGPFCQDQEGKRYHGFERSCKLDIMMKKLVATYRETSFHEWRGFIPHGSRVEFRCKGSPGLYKFIGANELKCNNGLWDFEIPKCIPTTAITNNIERSPPTINVYVKDDLKSVDGIGRIIVFPGTDIDLDCLYQKGLGTPEWTWTAEGKKYVTKWDMNNSPDETNFKISLYKVSKKDSGVFTCRSPNEIENTVSIQIEAATCDAPDNIMQQNLRIEYEGRRLGDKLRYFCPEGYTLVGKSVSTCTHNSKWSDSVPSCEPIKCPKMEMKDKNLVKVDYDDRYGGSAKYMCKWGYRMQGPHKVVCGFNGHWSSAQPTCTRIKCAALKNISHGYIIDDITGRVITTPIEHDIGTVLRFDCDMTYALIGTGAIICGEGGVWSERAPICEKQCLNPGNPAHGRLLPVKLYYSPGDSIIVDCIPNYIVHMPLDPIKCQEDGSWSHDIPQCIIYYEL